MLSVCLSVCVFVTAFLSHQKFQFHEILALEISPLVVHVNISHLRTYVHEKWIFAFSKF